MILLTDCSVCFANILLRTFVFLFKLILACNFLFLWYHIKFSILDIGRNRRKQPIWLKVFMYENPSAVIIFNGELLNVSLLRFDIIQGYLLTIVLFNITLEAWDIISQKNQRVHEIENNIVNFLFIDNMIM